jgi:hypothetical protein
MTTKIPRRSHGTVSMSGEAEGTPPVGLRGHTELLRTP